MARARNIKPNFFKNYDLADCGPYAQLLFAGLWCLADREGLLEDKPRFIKAELFPYYEVDINGELTKLQRLKFIDRYTENGVDVISIVNFKKHQSPHNTEKKSELPSRSVNDCFEKKNKITVNPQLDNGGNPPDSLIPDSLIPEVSVADESAPLAFDFLKNKKNSPITFKSFYVKCLAEKTKPIPDDDPVFNYCTKAKIDYEFVEIAWMKFKEKYLDDDKRYKDWRKVFRNCVHDNWYKIWYTDVDGNVVLTSQGRTLQTYFRNAA